MKLMNSSNTLRVRRAERGVSQFDVARAAGISRDRYWRVEKGYAEPTQEEVGALARVFAVEAAVLFPHGTDPTRPGTPQDSTELSEEGTNAR